MPKLAIAHYTRLANFECQARNGGDMSSSGFAARALSAAARNANAANANTAGAQAWSGERQQGSGQNSQEAK